MIDVGKQIKAAKASKLPIMPLSTSTRQRLPEGYKELSLCRIDDTLTAEVNPS